MKVKIMDYETAKTEVLAREPYRGNLANDNFVWGVEKSWLNRGSLLICCGYRRGEDDFVCKTYKNSIFNHQLMKIVNVDNGKLDIQSERWNEENSDEN